MGEMGSATCMICGRKLPIQQMESIFTGRTKYRCYECISNGNQQVKSRICNGYMKRLKERKE